MATEADTSGSELVVPDNRHHYRRQRQSHRQNSGSLATGINFWRDSKSGDDHHDNGVEKLISVDDFDDSDSEDTHSCSTTSPTPSDQAVNSSVSSRQPTSRGRNTSHFSSSYKLRKNQELASKVLDEEELQSLRLKINSRERKRMHDLNSALDGLREVMPYAHGPSVRKMSKIATLLLAKNYILMLNSSLEEMKKLVSDIYTKHGPSPAMTQVPGCHPVAPQSMSSATSSNNGSQPIDSRSGGITNGVQTPPNKSTDVPENYSYPPAALPLAHLTHHHTPIPSAIPLPVAGLRTSAHGLPSREVNSLACHYLLPKSEPTSVVGLSPSLASRECTRHLQPWGMPCSCAPCVSSSGHLAFSLHLNRFSQPMLTSSPALQRKH
ncbi:hypothetical protein BsWGS_12622 [Bradybaena similaris]